ncbi:TetR/AcrR family transcriptional regulator [Gammaproteobacteria bacterium]|jgi:AcrR family transcriptional regulator|nr:TetR/AcrR family transcriptional regulator [Gammaproteobacteria bacterium]|tara:strand:+ start:52 stop:663 length:612 start_codon:yes stop_codon:yes gene_type:complete
MTQSLKAMKKTILKGRKNVEKRLIDSAAELLSSLGPNQLSIRDIALHAGVNHAQIHHYFGGKQGLLEATYKQLAFTHMQQLERRNINVMDLGDEPLSDVTDNYFNALIRAVLDGKMDLLMAQSDSGLSMSKKTLSDLTKLRGASKPSAEEKAAVALVMVMEFGWAASKSYIKQSLKVSDKEMKVFMKLFVEGRNLGLNQLKKK